jgi:hypothetical protein
MKNSDGTGTRSKKKTKDIDHRSSSATLRSVDSKYPEIFMNHEEGHLTNQRE